MRAAKRHYKDNVKLHFQHSIPRHIGDKLRTIMDYKPSSVRCMKLELSDNQKKMFSHVLRYLLWWQIRALHPPLLLNRHLWYSLSMMWVELWGPLTAGRQWDQMAYSTKDVCCMCRSAGHGIGFKTSVIVPIPKNTHPASLNYYHPVALTSVVMKCFEMPTFPPILTRCNLEIRQRASPEMLLHRSCIILMRNVIFMWECCL